MSDLHGLQTVGLWLRLAAAAVSIALLGLTPIPARLTDSAARAQAAAESGDFALAAAAYHAAYDYQPWRTDFLAAAAAAEMRGSLTEAAENDLYRLSDIRPLTAQEKIWLGTIYAGRDQIDEAAALWEQAGGAGQVDPALLTGLADTYAARGDWEHAIAALKALTRFYPQEGSYYARLGIVQALDHPAESSVTLSQAASFSMEDALRLSPLRAVVDERATQPPDLAFARLGITYLSLGEDALAEEALGRAVAYNPVYADALAYLGYVQVKQGEPGLGAAQQAAALAPESPTVFYLLGLTWQELNRPPDARLAFERAYELDPANPAIAVEIASTHRAEGATQWAEIWMKEAVRLAPDDARFKLLLAQFYVDEDYKVVEEGFELARQLAAQFPDDPIARDILAWAYFLMGDLDSAQAELDRAMTLDPNLARVHLHMGVLLEARGRPAEALWFYINASTLDPDGTYGALARRAIERLGGS